MMFSFELLLLFGFENHQKFLNRWFADLLSSGSPSLWPQGLKDSETGNFWIPTNALWLREERWKNPWVFGHVGAGCASLEGLPEVRGG